MFVSYKTKLLLYLCDIQRHNINKRFCPLTVIINHKWWSFAMARW